MAKAFRHEHHYMPRKGDRVRTITTPTGHRVRVAFSKGKSKLVSILHPFGENPGHECVDVHFATDRGQADYQQNGVRFSVAPKEPGQLKPYDWYTRRETAKQRAARITRKKVDPATASALRRLFRNPGTPTLIYPRVEEIRAIKPDGQPYFHPFTSGQADPPFTGAAKAYGLDNGDVLITTRTL